MQKKSAVLFTILMILTLSSGQAFAEDGEQAELANSVNTDLVRLGEDSVIVAAVKAENAKGNDNCGLDQSSDQVGQGLAPQQGHSIQRSCQQTAKRAGFLFIIDGTSHGLGGQEDKQNGNAGHGNVSHTYCILLI